MRTLLIGYDLNRAGQNYDAVWSYIKGLGPWWHHLDSTWIVRTGLSPVAVRDWLKAAGIDGHDECLVVDISGQARAWTSFKESGSKWLRDNI